MYSLKLRFGDIGKEKVAKSLYLDLFQYFKDSRDKFECVYKFLLQDIPQQVIDVLNNSRTLYIKSANGQVLYNFKIGSFRKYSDLNKVFSSYRQFIDSLDIEKLSKHLKENNVELIGIDESKLDTFMQGSIATYLKSVAFRIFKQGNGKKQEIIGPIVQEFKISYESEEKAEKKNQFVTYLRNMYVIYVSILNSLIHGYKPIVFLHGPLVRAIGGFTDLHFSYEELRSIFSVEVLSEEEIHSDVLSFIRQDRLIKNLHEKEKEFLNTSNREQVKKLIKRHDGKVWKMSLPYEIRDNEGDITFIGERNYRNRFFSALSIYLFLLKELYKLVEDHNIILIGVVEDISKSTEFTTYILPNLFFEHDNSFKDWIPECIKTIISSKIYVKPNSPDFRREIYRYAYKIAKDYLQLRDIILFTQLLNEGDYTSPMHIMRYLNRNIYSELWGISELGIDNDFQIFIDHHFPYPDYRIVASYIRTTPHREPIRAEFFDIYSDYTEVLGLVYYLSLFYPNYGLPIILKYADLVARVPKKLIEIIVTHEIKNILLGKGFGIDTIMRVMNLFSRNFFRR